MAGRRLLPDNAQLLRHIDNGMTHEEIGQLYGTTRQAVTLRLNGLNPPRVNRREWPWEVQTRHKRGWLYLALSYYVIARTKERTLRKQEQHTLTAFLDMMDQLNGDFVVDYYPDTAVGFQLRERIEGHDEADSLIGVPHESAATA